jgi:hypothetical protein
VSSQLLEYEIWNRVNALGQQGALGNDVRSLLDRTHLNEMSQAVLAPWPTPIRTLDALHLATLQYLGRDGEAIELATYYNRMAVAARALGIATAAL